MEVYFSVHYTPRGVLITVTF